MEGQALKWVNYLSGWQKRYFVLKENEITYYDDAEHYKKASENFRGSISISRNASNIQVTGLFITISCISSKESLYLQFLNEEDKSAWLVQIGTSRACQSMAINFPEEAAKGQKSRKSSNSGKSLSLSLKAGSINSEDTQDKFLSAPETHDNHKDLLTDEIKSIQAHLNNYLSLLEKSTNYVEDITKDDDMTVASVNLPGIEAGTFGSRFFQKGCDGLLKAVTENLCKIQMLNKEYYDMVSELEGDVVTGGLGRFILKNKKVF